MSQAGILNNAEFQPGSVVQTIEGNTGGPVSPDVTNNIHVVGDGTTVTIVGNPGTNTLTASFIGSTDISLHGDTGVITGDDFTFNAQSQAGSSISFSAAATTMSLNVTDALDNTIIGLFAGNALLTGIENNAVGRSSLISLTTGDSNAAFGYSTLVDLTTGDNNVALGAQAIDSLISGSNNIAVGFQAGLSYNTSESSNIAIGALGTTAESNTLRIGTNGASDGQQNRCFIAGIDGVNVGSTATIVTESANQLGTAVLTAGTGITITPGANTITVAATGVGMVETLTGNSGGAVGPTANNINTVGDGTTITIVGNPGTSTLTASLVGGRATQSFVTDSGTATPSSGAINIKANTSMVHAGSSVSFSGSGNTVLFNVTDASDNTLIGATAGNITLTGTENSALGRFALEELTSGDDNCAFGFLSLNDITSGSDNVAFGSQSLNQLVTGTHNIGIGFQAGATYTTSESSNIVIGAAGVIAESNTLRLGTNGGGAGQQNRCFVAGVDGVNVGSTATIVTEASNQLGTAVITAGAGITITPTANVITVAGSGTLTYTNVAASPYVVLSTDQFISVNCSGGAITVQLPNAATLGKVYVIKDRTGSAATNNITVTTVGGAVNIDAATTFVMNTAYQAISIMGNGTTYEIY